MITSKALAARLLEISTTHDEIFIDNPDGYQGYEEKDAAWLSYLEHSIDAAELNVSHDDMTDGFVETLFAALDSIDEQNESRPEGQKQRLHEDVVRAIMYNKGASSDLNFRYEFLKRDCTRQPITGFGAFCMFYTKRPQAGGVAPGLSRSFTHRSQGAMERLSDYEVLTITRADGMKGLLGGLVDMVEGERPLNPDIASYLKAADDELGELVMAVTGLDDITFDQDVNGQTVDGAAEGIADKLAHDRVALEAMQAISGPLKVLVAEYIKSQFLSPDGASDNVEVDLQGVLRRINIGSEDGLRKVHARGSRRETIEELTNVLEALEQHSFLDENEMQRDIRARLFTQLRQFVGSLVTFEKQKADVAQAAGQTGSATVDTPSNPFGHAIRKVPIDSVRDDAYAYGMWFPKDLSEALRPPKFPKVRLVRPMGGLQQIEYGLFQVIYEAGVEARKVREEILAMADDSANAELEAVKTLIEGLEVRGLEKDVLGDLISKCGDTRGVATEKATGFNDNNFRYQHEWAAALALAIEEFRDSPVAGISLEESVIGLCEAIQENIIQNAVTTDDIYMFQPITAVRMMRGGKLVERDGLSPLRQAFIVDRDLGLAEGTLVKAQKAVNAVLADHDIEISYAGSVQDKRFGYTGFAFGDAPKVPELKFA